MSLHSVIKMADWTISPDRSEGASPPIRQSECTRCGAVSEPSTIQLDTDRWALQHAASTRHTGFREITTAFLRVTRAEGNPCRKGS